MQLNPLGSTADVTKYVDNGMRVLTNNVLAFYTNNTEKMRINSSGYVGIGTVTNLTEKLQINGRLKIHQTTAPTDIVDKLYNVNGILYWNGIDLTGSGLGGNWSMINGNVYRLTGYVGIGTSDPTIDLAIGSNDTGLKTIYKDLLFYTNGLERMRIDITGNIGINTSVFSNESAKLSINTGIEIKQITSPSNTSNLLYNYNGRLYWKDTDISSSGITDRIYNSTENTYIQTTAYLESININTNGVERMFIDSNGNIGIGIHAPENALHMSSSGTLRFDNENSGQKIILWNGDYGAYTGFGKDDGFLTFSIYSNEDNFSFIEGFEQNELMRLTGDGKIGLGIQIPTEKIHIYDTSSDIYITLEGSSSYCQGINFRNSTNQIIIPAEENSFLFKLNSDTKMIIDESGNVGIGTLLASSKLHVVGNITCSSNIICSNIINNNITCTNIQMSGYLSSLNANVSSIFMGNVGIGSNIPTEKLDIVGDAQITGNLKVSSACNVKKINANGKIDVYTGDSADALIKLRSSTTSGTNNSLISFYSHSSSITSGELEGDIRLDNSGSLAFLNASDRRLKQNIREFTTGYDIIKNLESVIFDWKGNKPNNNYGFIAQDVQKHIPEAVEKMNNGLLGLNQQKLIPVLWSCIRTLIKKVELLEKR